MVNYKYYCPVEIIKGYKKNVSFQKDQLLKCLNLSSYHSYVSLQVVSDDDRLLFDKIIPEVFDLFGSYFPFVVLKSAGLNVAEFFIVFVDDFRKSFDDLNYCADKIQDLYGCKVL